MKKSYKYTLLALVGIWAVVMIVLSPQFVAANRETKNALLVFDRYSTSLVNERYEQAYQECGTDFRNAMTYDEFVALQRSFQAEFGPLRSLKRSGYHLKGSGTPIRWNGTFDADLIYEKKNLRFRFELTKEGDRWVLFGYKQL